MKYCPRCGHDVEGMRKFCGICGFEINVQPETLSQDNTNNSTNKPTNAKADRKPVNAGINNRPVNAGINNRPVNAGINNRPINARIDNKPKREKDPVNSNKLLFSSLQILFYIIIGVVTVAFLFLQYGVRVKTSIGDGTFQDFSFFSVMQSMITGDNFFNPTIASIALGVAGLVAGFGTAVFWVLSAIFKLFNKGKGLHIISIIFTVINTVYLCLYLPLTARYSNLLYAFYAKQLNCFLKDVTSIKSIWAYIFSAVIIMLLAAELVFASLEKKNSKNQRRKKNG